MFRKSKFSKNLTNFTTDSTVRTCLNHPMLADILADASWTFFCESRRKRNTLDETTMYDGQRDHKETPGSLRSTRSPRSTPSPSRITPSFFQPNPPLPIAFWTLEARQLKKNSFTERFCLNYFSTKLASWLQATNHIPRWASNRIELASISKEVKVWFFWDSFIETVATWRHEVELRERVVEIFLWKIVSEWKIASARRQRTKQAVKWR